MGNEQIRFLPPSHPSSNPRAFKMNVNKNPVTLSPQPLANIYKHPQPHHKAKAQKMKTAHIWIKIIKSLQAHSLKPLFSYCCPSPPTPNPPTKQALMAVSLFCPPKMAFECREVSEGPRWVASWGSVTGHWTLKWAVSVTKGPFPLEQLQGDHTLQPPLLLLYSSLIKLGIVLCPGLLRTPGGGF